MTKLYLRDGGGATENENTNYAAQRRSDIQCSSDIHLSWYILFRMTFVGADLGGTKLAVAAFTDDGELISREAIPLAGRRGAADRGARDAIFLARGTGIGAGILSDSKVVRGHGDVAGAIGWLALDRPFMPRYVQHGCLEDQASGPGLVRVVRDLIRADASYDGALRSNDPKDLEAGDIFAAHERGDKIATKVIDNAIELWGMAVANLVSLFNPEIIVFGGGVFGPGAKFIDRIHTEARRWAQPIAIEQVRLVVSSLGTDAGLFGAGRLAMIVNQGTST